MIIRNKVTNEQCSCSHQVVLVQYTIAASLLPSVCLPVLLYCVDVEYFVAWLQ